MANFGTGSVRMKEYDDVRTVRVREDRDDGTVVVKTVRVPGWVAVEESHEPGISRGMDDVKTGRREARLAVLRERLARAEGKVRSVRGRRQMVTRRVNRQLEDLGGVDPKELARLICSRP